MANKTISLSEDTSNHLARAKGEDESFSDAIDRLLCEDEHPLYDIVGLLNAEDIEPLWDRSNEFRDGVNDQLGVDDSPR